MATATATHNDADVRKLLEGTQLKTVVQKQQRIQVFEHDNNIGDILEILCNQRLLSGPVVVRQDSQTPGDLTSGSGQVPLKSLLGFVDVGEILRALLEGLTKEDVEAMTVDAIEAKAAELCARPVLSLFGPQASASYLTVISSEACSDYSLKGNMKSSLLSVIREGFLLHHKHTINKDVLNRGTASGMVHRLAVWDYLDDDSPPHIVAVFSQSDVVKFLAKHKDALGEVLGKPLHEVFPAKMRKEAQVLTVRENCMTLEAFRRMQMGHVSGVGVVDASAVLRGHLSAGDLRCLAGPAFFSSLLLPVKRFLEERPLMNLVQQQLARIKVSAGGPSQSALTPRSDFLPSTLPSKMVTFHADDSLGDAISSIVANKVHRLYVVDKAGHPESVLTLTDILALFSALCGNNDNGKAHAQGERGHKGK